MIPRLLTLLTLLLFSLIVIAIKKLFIKIKSEDSEEDYLDPSFNISYKDAENLLGSSVIEEKHIMINEGLEKINSAIQKFENFSGELGQISIKRYEIPDFLKNTTTNSSLGIVKSDLELYISIFDELIKRANNIAKLLTESINIKSRELNEMKKKLIEINSEFEVMTKKLSIPLILSQKTNDINTTEKNKDRLDEIEYEIKNYKGNITILYDLLNKPFEYFIWCYTIIPNIIGEYTKESALISNNIIQVTNEAYNNLSFLESSNAHNLLIKTKNSLSKTKEKAKNINDNFTKVYAEFEQSYKSKKSFLDFEEFKKNYTKIIKILQSNIKSIKNYIKDYQMPNIKVPELIQEEFIKGIDDLFKKITINQEQINGEMNIIIETIEIEAKTSLDLLFVMDITGSMGPYLNQVKINMINIINRIILECPGIDINIGFIGYLDVQYQSGLYIDYDLTKNHTYLKEIINKVQVISGPDDIIEDLTGGLEMALNKTWKNNARFIVLVGDVPCHGKICHNGRLSDEFPDGVPGQRNITEIVKDLANNKISLFCMRITTDTEKMFEMFRNIYKDYKDIEFHVDDVDKSDQRFSNIVVESAKRVYVNQRNINVK